MIARTEALISGLGNHEAVSRATAYAAAGADALLIHSKADSPAQIETFLQSWDRTCPVVVVPTTYPDWHADDVAKAGVSVVIYANQGLRAMVSTLRETFGSILDRGSTSHLESLPRSETSSPCSDRRSGRSSVHDPRCGSFGSHPR